MDDKLNYFGKILISDVRDRTIHGFDKKKWITNRLS